MQQPVPRDVHYGADADDTEPHADHIPSDDATSANTPPSLLTSTPRQPDADTPTNNITEPKELSNVDSENQPTIDIETSLKQLNISNTDTDVTSVSQLDSSVTF